jgi:elongation factor Ts
MNRVKITTEMIKELRTATGAGVLDVKKALEAAGGDFEIAAASLREKGAAREAKRVGREAGEGVVEVYSHPGNRVGVMLELNSETDFVARNENFQSLAHDLVLHIAAMQPLYISREDIPASDIERVTRELKEQALEEGKSADIVDRIVGGRLEKFYEEISLLDQPFVKDDARKVKDLVTDAIRTFGENIVIRRFSRYELGEPL